MSVRETLQAPSPQDRTFVAVTNGEVPDASRSRAHCEVGEIDGTGGIGS